MSSFTPGLRLHDRFTLVELLGTGGMSQVWRAVDEVLGRTVAVKVLGSTLAADPVLRQATWREARAAARLAHPHVIQVYDYGEAAIGGDPPVPYLVMELIEGRTLADRLADGPLPWSEVLTIGAQVAAALAAAHRLGVVHRDIKPSNVMLTPGGAKVLDFGIAALAGHRSDDGGFRVGTPAYMAPEQLGSAPPQPAGDVYALGVLLYRALTGRVPFAATSWEEAQAFHRGGHPVPPPHLPGLPAAATQLVMAAMAPNPAHRPSAEELAARLAAAVGLPDPTTALRERTTVLPLPPPPDASARGAARPPSPPTMVQPLDAAFHAGPAPAPGRARRLPVVAGVLVAAALAVAVGAVALRPDEPARVPAAAAPPATSSAPAPTSPTAPTTAPTRPVPTDRAGILAELHRTLDDAVETRAMSGDVADELRDKVDKLRDTAGRGKGNPRKRAEEWQKKTDDLRKAVTELRDDDDVDAATATRLFALLRALSAAQPAAE
ncbi:serine/threonine protein kinase [Micromonospora pattaloongensis]|uniref:non-specific serine/threonine protein kinase n=1 Tax=Micromonospora pattaloongensis TaxID=405436 RepID=A0A1H3QT44_9ACTN|nr:serine/threonine-protein kinase [Micromonospora pattaloongensis]SDZ16576.1 serine/threonine protein kinase [Micromonospora pattaloongensis]